MFLNRGVGRMRLFLKEADFDAFKRTIVKTLESRPSPSRWNRTSTSITWSGRSSATRCVRTCLLGPGLALVQSLTEKWRVRGGPPLAERLALAGPASLDGVGPSAADGRGNWKPFAAA